MLKFKSPFIPNLFFSFLAGFFLFFLHISSVEADTCNLTSAKWNTLINLATVETEVALVVNGTGCSGSELSFKVYENDSLLEGIFDEEALIKPGNAIFSGDVASATWIAEWQNDCGGFCNPPEYYFVATVVASGRTIRSNNPLLNTAPKTTILNTESSVTSNFTPSRIPTRAEISTLTQDIAPTQVSIQSFPNQTQESFESTENPFTFEESFQSSNTEPAFAFPTSTQTDFLAETPTQQVNTPTPEPELPTAIPTQPLIRGDANNDGQVNGFDYIIWLNNSGRTTSAGPSEGDFDQNGVNNQQDLDILLDAMHLQK